MSELSKRLEQVIDRVRDLPVEQQDLLAVELDDRAKVLNAPAFKLSPTERAELQAELAAARRGELATDDEVAAMYARHGL